MPFDQTLEPSTTERFVVALAHPSLDDAVALFSTEIRAEQRYFGNAAPKLPASSLSRLNTPGGLRLGVMVNGRLIAMSRVDRDGDAVMAVVQPSRGQGVGRQLLQATLSRAASQGCERVIFRSSRRSKAFVSLAETVDATLVDHGSGRIDLIFAVKRITHIA
ncbi:MAG: GNAT superfamily N-acetyltransferase [Candidatus Aldehydirespiratoraceae bacterium]|jgi:GNAT superfamily N-acetyltransferase